MRLISPQPARALPTEESATVSAVTAASTSPAQTAFRFGVCGGLGNQDGIGKLRLDQFVNNAAEVPDPAALDHFRGGDAKWLQTHHPVIGSKVGGRDMEGIAAPWQVGEERPHIDPVGGHGGVGAFRAQHPSYRDAGAARGFADGIDGWPVGPTIGGDHLPGRRTLEAHEEDPRWRCSRVAHQEPHGCEDGAGGRHHDCAAIHKYISAGGGGNIRGISQRRWRRRLALKGRMPQDLGVCPSSFPWISGLR